MKAVPVGPVILVTTENATRTKLVSTAMDLLWESSYASVSVEDICAKAGVNKGSFYYAFKSKIDLVLAAIERRWELRRPLLDAAFSPQVPPLNRVERYCQLITAEQRQKYTTSGKVLGCFVCSVGSEMSTQNDEIRRLIEVVLLRNQKYFESLIRDLVAEGLIQKIDTSQAAAELGYYITGVLMQAKIENNVHQVDRLERGIFRYLGLK